MNLDSLTVIAATVLGGSGIAGVLSLLISRGKIAAEAKAINVKGELQIVDAANSLVGILREELDRLLERVNSLEQKQTALEAENSDLKVQIEALHRENVGLASRCEGLERENRSLRQKIRELK